MSNFAKVLALDETNKKFVPLEVNSSGEMLISSTTLATLTEQQSHTTHLATIAGDTTSLDSKITACNTGAVIISSGSVELTKTDKGSRNNVEANLSILTNAVSSLSPSVANFQESGHLYYDDTLTGNTSGVAVEVSIDGNNWHHHNIFFPQDNYNATKRVASVQVNCNGLDKLRIRNLAGVTATTVNCSIVA